MNDEISNRFDPDRLRLDVGEVRVLHLDWENKGQPFKLPNGLLKIDGVSPQSKRRALRELARLGLISVEWRPRKSPIVLRLK